MKTGELQFMLNIIAAEPMLGVSFFICSKMGGDELQTRWHLHAL
ncbi:MAG: hypothetical protein ACSLEN_09080 [Candidatus Malihini olakiniferum]